METIYMTKNSGFSKTVFKQFANRNLEMRELLQTVLKQYAKASATEQRIIFNTQRTPPIPSTPSITCAADQVLARGAPDALGASYTLLGRLNCRLN